MKTKKQRKKRVLSEAQKEALRERLVKMRANRKPAEYKNIHNSVLALDDEDPYSFNNMKLWIKHNKEMISMLTAQSRNREITEKNKNLARVQAENKKGFIRYIEHYLRTGDWIGMFSGQDEEHKCVPKCIAMAYYPDGTPKRTVGTWYPDIETVWTKDMESDSKSPILMATTDKQFTSTNL